MRLAFSYLEESPDPSSIVRHKKSTNGGRESTGLIWASCFQMKTHSKWFVLNIALKPSV